MQNIFFKKNLLENLRDRLYMTKEKLGQKWCLKKSNENVQSVSKKHNDLMEALHSKLVN